jgi:hypothetical protein
MRDTSFGWYWIIAVLVVLLALLVGKECHASDNFYGVGIFAGEQWQKGIAHVSPDYNWQELQIKPMMGKHMSDRWDLWLEGNLGWMKWNDGHNGITLGALGMMSYDIIQYKCWSVYNEMGVGLGWTDHTPSTNLLRNNVLGLIDCGIGLKFKYQDYVIKLGPRFHHSSAILAHDCGINTYGMITTFLW